MVINKDEAGLQELDNGPSFDDSQMKQLDGATAALAKQGLETQNKSKDALKRTLAKVGEIQDIANEAAANLEK